jgi:outer membrane lipoprotein-sorting protein
MPQIRIGFGTNDLALRFTELRFADGSTMRNDFRGGKINPSLDETLFTPKIEDGFKIVEPMRAGR